MTTIFLAYAATSPNSTSAQTLRAWDWQRKPLGLLVSFYYLKSFRVAEQSGAFVTRSRMLDSGAFSAWASGKKIDIAELISEARRPDWTESVALDVIGDAEGSAQNWRRMRDAGTRAMPTFHFGEPWEYLDEYRRGAEKIAIGGLVGRPRKETLRFCEQVFARAWPHKFHAFGKVNREALIRLPFHSADSSSWDTGPCAFGSWAAFGGAQLKIGRAKVQTLEGMMAAEIEFYWRLQQELTSRWSRELCKLEQPCIGSEKPSTSRQATS